MLLGNADHPEWQEDPEHEYVKDGIAQSQHHTIGRSDPMNAEVDSFQPEQANALVLVYPDQRRFLAPGGHELLQPGDVI